jgi:short-subunit dehydrogenase
MFSWETGGTYTENTIKTNITGMIYGSQVAAERMLKQGYGAIYSMEGLGSNNMIQKKTILYGTTKHALTYFMKGLAKELEGTGVIAGRLSPGMMLTDFITKTPDGERSEVIADVRFKRIFNILADKPETVAKFFIPRILGNTKNDAHIAWLTNRKVTWRFVTASLRKDRLI